jgi:putative phosphoesterase
MKIGIISDTHDKLPAINAAFKVFQHEKVLLVVHCGDWKSLSTLEYVITKAQVTNIPVRGVLGNNDAENEAFLQLARSFSKYISLTEGVDEFEAEGKKIAAYHGHHAPTLRKLRASDVYDVVCLGHTHKPKVEQLDQTIILNPGSTAFAIPRSKTWQPTVIIFDTDTMIPELLTI